MSRYSILIVYDTEGWAYHNNARALQKYCQPDFEVLISSTYRELLSERSFDLVLFLPFSHTVELHADCDEMVNKPLIVSVFSVGWGYANEWLEEIRPCTDGVIISSHRMWDKSGRLDGTWYLPSGVDLELFNITRPIKQRQPKLLWCGSEFHRKVKGYDDILVPLRDCLQAQGLEVELRLVDSTGPAKYTPEEMAAWYNSGTIYLCTSLAEGTPNPCLEAAACGCTLIATPVGNMPELIQQGWNGYLVKWEIEAFLEKINDALPRYIVLAHNMQSTIRKWSWKHQAKGYFDLFRKLIDTAESATKS